jgi:hypothetical protein
MDDPVDSLVKGIKANIAFLDDLVKKNNLILGTVGLVGFLMVIVLLLR